MQTGNCPHLEATLFVGEMCSAARAQLLTGTGAVLRVPTDRFCCQGCAGVPSIHCSIFKGATSCMGQLLLFTCCKAPSTWRDACTAKYNDIVVELGTAVAVCHTLR